MPIPYSRTADYQALGYPDSTDDIRGAVGPEGYKALYAFVQQGGTLITEGSTAAILPEMKLTPGVTAENPPTLFARGTILRGVIADRHSPLVYGYERGEVPVYFNSSPVLNAGAGAPPPVAALAESTATPNAGPGGRNAARPNGQNTTPMATQPTPPARLNRLAWTGGPTEAGGPCTSGWPAPGLSSLVGVGGSDRGESGS